MQENKRNTEKKKFSWPKKVNKWKVAFLILLGIVIGSAGFFFYRAGQIREDIPSATNSKRAGTPVLSVQSSKDQLNSLMDFYLENYQKKADVTYQFRLENQALLTGQFKILGQPITFYLYFDPFVTDDGNVLLKADSLSIGTLSLPIKQVMSMIEKNFKFPKWVQFDTKEQTVLLRLDQFKMDNGLFVKAERINLVEDDIQVSLYLPSDKKE